MSLVGAIPSPNAAADELLVTQPAKMAMKGFALIQRQHIAARLAVQQQGQFAGPEQIGVFTSGIGCRPPIRFKAKRIKAKRFRAGRIKAGRFRAGAGVRAQFGGRFRFTQGDSA